MDGSKIRADCLRRGFRGVGFALELHSDLDEVKRVGGAAGNDRSDASFDKTFDTHVEFSRETNRKE